jgi:Cytochrome P460
MSAVLISTNHTWAGGLGTEDAQDSSLKYVVIRLLAVALTMMRRTASRSHGLNLPLPSGYRGWPTIEIEIESGPIRHHLRIYVCAKAAVAADDEAFPIGTVLVVETVARSGSGEDRLLSVFVMGKFASTSVHIGSTTHQDDWTYALYDQPRRNLVNDSSVCGVCRLPFM